MTRFFTVLLGAAVLCSCSNSNYTITGRYNLAPGDSVFLFAYDKSILASGVIGADTTFTLKGTLTTPDIVTISDRDRLELPATLFLQPGEIRIEPAEGGYDATGTPLNDSMKLLNTKLLSLRDEYFQMTQETPQEEVEALMDRFWQIPREMMNANLDNIFGLHLFNTYEFGNSLQDSTKFSGIKTQMAAFTPEMQAHPMMQKLRKKLAGFENAQVGKPYTDLTLPNTNGELVALSSLVGPGHWVLLDFWATWCSPCMNEVQYLKQAYATYKDRGFEIYGISLDNNTERWKKLVAENDMPWINVLGVDEDKQSATADLYSITGIPANFLISPDGVIAAKNLRGDELEKKLAEVLK